MGYKKRLKKQLGYNGRPKTLQQRRVIIQRIMGKYLSSAQYAIAHLKPRLSAYFERQQNRKNKKQNKKPKYNSDLMPSQVQTGFNFLLTWFLNDFKDHENQREFRGVDISKTYDINTLIKRCFSRIQHGQSNVIQSMRDVIHNYDLRKDLEGQTLDWKVRLLPNFINTFKNLDFFTKIDAFKRIVKLQLGYFQDITVHRVGPIKYHFLAMVRLNHKFNITFGVFPQRVPIYSYQQKFVLNKSPVDQERSQNMIKQYLYRQVIVILDLVKTHSEFATSFKKSQVMRYLNQIEEDPDRWGCFSILSDRDCKVDLRSHIYQYSGDQDEPQLSYTLKSYAESAKWFVGFLQKIPNFKLHLTEQESNTIGQNGNVLALGRSGTGKTTCSVLRLFATEVLFKLRLRHLMNIRNQQNDGAQLDKKKKERFNYQDLGMSCGLHMVFVTASPVLTTQVKRFYESLKDKVSEELKKVKERMLKRREQRLKKLREEQDKKQEVVVIDKAYEQQSKESNGQIGSDEEDDEQLGELKTELKLDELKAQQDKIEDELDLQQQLNLPDTFYHMNSDDFPVFLTIRRMIFMIDGCFTRSFFVRNSNRQIVGQSTSSQWHNQSKGVMLINRYFKSSERLENNSQKYISNDMANLNQLLDSSSGSDDQSENQNDDGINETKNPQLQQDQDEFKPLKGKKKKKEPQAVQVYSTEVDYDLFEHRIWPRIRNRNRPHITSSVVWAQIMNRLKGGAQAYLHPAGYLQKFYYLLHYAKSAPKRYNQNFKLSKSAKKGQKQLFYEDYQEIFEIFIKYERWKVNYGAFDFCDVVNHILYCLHAGYAYRGAPLHFTMCDQVQDLAPCVSLLLIKLSEYCFFSGDSAQTIAKGVGFKFSDLTQLFNTRGFYTVSQKKAPVLHQLSVNFRSHGKILDLANAIIKMIEIGYPDTIDKLKRQVSWQDGMKPIILDSNMVECLFGLLVGTQALQKEENKNNKQESSGLISKPPVQFGCDQVVIVRDQKAKHNLPEILCHALCLTIFQSKGLQFDDVILYNFFTDSPLSEKEWALIKQIKVKSLKHTDIELRTMDTKNKQKYDLTVDAFGVKTSIQKHEKTEQQIREYIDENYKVIGQAMNKHVKQNPDVDINTLKYQDFIQDDDKVVKYTKQTILYLEDQYNDKARFNQELSLNTELKQLYVACTRPRKRLIIFDDDPTNRKMIHQIFKEIEAIQTITYNDIYGVPSIENQIDEKQPPPLLKKQSSQSGKKYIQKLANQTSQSSWRSQGIRMFKRKFYSAALHCFKKSNQPQLMKRSLAYVLAQKGANLQTQSQDLMQEIKIKDKNKAELNVLRWQAQKKQEESKSVFIESAKLFKQLGLIRQSAQCYYSGGNYNQAALSFLNIKYFAQAAECFYLSGNYEQAGKFYIQAGVHLKAVQMYMRDNNWEKILETINAAKGVLQEAQIQQLINKYTPQALNNLFEELSKKDQELKNEEEKQSMILEDMNQEDEEGVEDVEEEEEEEEEDGIDQQIKEGEQDNQKDKEKLDEVGGMNQQNLEENAMQDALVNQEKSEMKQRSPRQKESDQLSNFTLIDSIDVETDPKQIKRKDEDDDIKSQGGSSFVSLHMSQLNSTPDKIKKTKKISSTKSEYTIVDFNDEQDDFQHLSHIDPNDQFLKSQKGSIINSIVSIHRQSKKATDSKDQNLKSVASLSSYSIIQDEATTHIDASVYNKITPQRHRDLFAEDQMIQKFIYYISLISEDVQALMSQYRSKEVLIHADDQHQMPDQVQAVPAVIPAPQSKQIFLLDIDNIDINFLQVILNTLENFQLYAFCLIICNRYQLSTNIGRYIVSLAYKYSNQYQLKIEQIDLIMNNQQELINQKQVSAIAHGAVHNVFQRIDPVYLRLKKIGEEMNENNSVGLYAYRALWMLGYWKKLAFIMDSETSLTLLSTVGDYQGFKVVYNINFSRNGKVQELEKDGGCRKLDWIFPECKSQNVKEINKYQLMGLIQEIKQVNTEVCSQLLSKRDHTSYQIKGINLKYIQTIKIQDYQRIDKGIVQIFKEFFPNITKYWLILSDLIKIANQKNKVYRQFLNTLRQYEKDPQKSKKIKKQENKIVSIFNKIQNRFLERSNQLTQLALYKWFPLLKKITHNKRVKHNFKSQELTSWDLFIAISSYLIVASKWSPFKSYINYLVKDLLSYSEVLQFGSSLNILARILSSQGYSFFSTFDIAVSAFSQLFNCHHIPQTWLFENDSGYTIVQRKSQLLTNLLHKQKTIKLKQKQEIQQRILKKFTFKNKKSVKMEKQILLEMQKEQGLLTEQKEIRMGDLQGQFILAPNKWVMNLIQPIVIRFGKSLLLSKIKHMVEVPYNLKDIINYGNNFNFIREQVALMYGKDLQISLLNPPKNQLQEEKVGSQIKYKHQDLNCILIKYAKFQDIATVGRAMLFSYTVLTYLYKIMSLDPTSQPIYLNNLSNAKFNEKRLKQLQKIAVQAREKYSLLQDFTADQISYSKTKLNQFNLKKDLIVQQKLAIQFFENNMQQIIKDICRLGMLNYGTKSDTFILPQHSIKNVILQLASDKWRKAMEDLQELRTYDLIQKQDVSTMRDIFNYAYSSFTYFSTIDEIYIFQGLVRTFKQKSSKYLLINKKLVSQFYNSTMTLIDALVYYRQDCWSEAADCLLQYISATINFLSYKNQVFLFEKCTMLYLAAMASSGRLFNNSNIMMIQQQQYVHYPFVNRKMNQIETNSVAFEVDFQKPLVNSSNPKRLSVLTQKLFGVGYNLIKMHSEDLKKEKSNIILLNSIVSILINAPFNELMPKKMQITDLFSYIIESSNYNDQICEKFITAFQTKTLDQIQESLRNYQFKAKDIYFQLDKQIGQENSLVLVNFIKSQNKELKQRQNAAYKQLDKLFLKESQILASHIYLARLFKRNIEFDNKRIRSIRNNLKNDEHCKIAEFIRSCSHEGSDIDYKSVRISLRLKKDMINIIQNLDGMRSVVNNIFFKGQMQNVLDVHYLLTRYGQIGHQMKRVLNDMHNDLSHRGAIEKYNGNTHKLNENIREWIKMIRDTLSNWKITKFQVSRASIEHKRKIIKLKWKEHRIHQAQAALRKRKGQGKQKKLADKKKRISEQEIGKKGAPAKGIVKSLLAQKLLPEKQKKSNVGL